MSLDRAGKLAAMKNSKRMSVSRRRFLKGAAVGAAAVAATPIAKAQQPAQASGGSAPLSRAAETAAPADLEALTTDRPGSDFMVDILKALKFEYVVCESRFELPFAA